MMTTLVKRVLPLVMGLALSAAAQDSRLGTYHAQRSLTGGGRAAQELNELKVTVSDARGNRLQTITRKLPYDVGPPAVGVFESGSCALLDAFHGIVDFYDLRGTLVRTVRLFKESVPHLERVMPFAVHDFTLTLAVSDPSHANVRVVRFTEAGNVLFETDLAGEFATGVVLSNSGDLCAVGTSWWNSGSLEESTALISSDGIVVRSFPAGCIVGTFADADSLLLIANKREYAVLSSTTGAVVSHAAVDEGEIILDVNADGSARYILSARNPALEHGAWTYSQPSVVRIDSLGIHRDILGESGLHFSTARLKSIGGQMMLQLDSTLQRVP